MQHPFRLSTRRLPGSARAFLLGMIAAGTLAGLQGTAAFAAGEVFGTALARTGHAAPRAERVLLGAPSLPFPGNGSNSAAATVTDAARPIMLPRSLRSVGLKSVRRFNAQKALSLPHATTRRPSGEAGANRPASGSGFFGSTAIPFANIASAKDWDRVRHRKLPVPGEQSACQTQDCRARIAILASYSRPETGGSFFQKLELVNSVVNRNIRYQEDQTTYNRLDYWATTDEIVRNGAGDCEDFAILKYAMLLEAGVPETSMSLVILKDTNRNLFHAVLAVSTNKGHFILDNVVNRVYSDREVPHYRPMFSFSTDRAWIHGTPKGGDLRRVSSLETVAPGLDRSADTAISRTAGDQDRDRTGIYPVTRD